jgi:hypothetical protein
MSTVTGIISAAGWAAVMLLLLLRADQNLPATTGRLVEVVVLAVAITAGFLTGSTIARRARRARDHFGLFSALTGAIGGGLIGGTCLVALDASYLSAYASWPQSRVDDILLLASYPALGALGFALGALWGTLGGIVLGTLVRAVVRPANS